jgi:hypothetical protein
VPVFESGIAFELARGVKVFLKVEAGVTRDKTAESIYGSGAMRLYGASGRDNARVPRLKEAGSRILSKRRAFGARSRHRTGREESDGMRPEKMVWFFAAARTGSTWLASMIGEMKEQTVWHDPLLGYLFGHLYYERAAHLIGKESKTFILGGGYRDSWLKSIRTFVLSEATVRFPEVVASNDYLVVKEPNGSIGAPLLMEALPESRMILLVRDPRDVAASSMDARRKGGWQYENRNKEDQERESLSEKDPNAFIRKRASNYLQYISKAKEAYDAHEGRKALVRYEDLRADTLGEMKRLYASLEIPVEEKELTRAVKKHSWENIPAEEKGEGKFYRKAKPGGWREDLTPKQARVVEKITAPLLEEFYGAGAVPRMAADKPVRQQLEGRNRKITASMQELTEVHGTRSPPYDLLGSTSVFFVVGHQKSGTTWLMTMLDAHPEILCQGEGRPFGRDFKQEHNKRRRRGYPPVSLYNAIASSEDLRSWIERSVWSKRDNVDEHLRNLTRLAIEYFLTQQLSKTGKSMVGDKTVLLSPDIMTEIGVVIPSAKVIHIIRDGRDVAVSTIHHIWNQAEDQGGTTRATQAQLAKCELYRENPHELLKSGGGIFPDGWLGDYAASWSATVGKSVKDGPVSLGSNYAAVKYEDLLYRPAEEMGRLLRFLGAKADRWTVSRCVNEASFEKLSGGRDRGEEAASFYRKGVAGDWKSVFTEQNKQEFKAVAGDLLIELGYEENNDW